MGRSFPTSARFHLVTPPLPSGGGVGSRLIAQVEKFGRLRPPWRQYGCAHGAGRRCGSREPAPCRWRMDRSAEFRRWKAQSLSRADLSRKGSVDEDAAEVVELLNSREEFFTTSSCAGRILLLDGSTDGSGVQKQHCCWMLVTHKPCGKDDVMAALKGATSNAVLKFEPFILHVQCRTLQDAQTLHSVAIESGFRNSGITVGKRGKTMLAVRSTHGLEVPLSRQGKLMVTEEYIEFLVTIANQKMEENKKRIGSSQLTPHQMRTPQPTHPSVDLSLQVL